MPAPAHHPGAPEGTGSPLGNIGWVDLDDEADEETIRRLVDAGVLMVESGTAGHFHAYPKLNEFLPVGQIEDLNKGMAAVWGGDSKWSNESLLRLVGTRNFKSGGDGQPVKFLVPPDEAKVFSLDELNRIIDAPRGGRRPVSARPMARPGASANSRDDSRSGRAWARIRSRLEADADDHQIVDWFTGTEEGKGLFEHYDNSTARLMDDIERAREKRPIARGSSVGGSSTLDAHMAQSVCDRALGGYCWTGATGWLGYSDGVWSPVTEATVIEVVRLDLINQLPSEALAGGDTNHVVAFARLLSKTRITGIVTLARGILERRIEEFDRHPDLLCVRNGVVDLPTGRLLPHDPGLLLTRRTPIDYVADAVHPDWEAVLSALPGEVVDWLQVRFGQAATGHMTDDDMMPVLQGTGENGKTTIVMTVLTALGDYAMLVPNRLLMARPDHHPTELTTLRGLRLAVIEEAPDRHLNIKRLKDVVGTPRMTARKVNRDDMTWEASHSLFLTTNHRLQISETDHGTWRRLALVVFRHRYVDDPVGPRDRRRDAGLRHRIQAGKDGQHEAVLAWVIAGARRWYDADRVMPPPPEQVVSDTEDWRAEVDMVLGFIRDELVFDPNAAIASTDLAERFNVWLVRGHHEQWSERTIADRFGGHYLTQEHGVRKERRRNRSSVHRGRWTVPDRPAMAWLGVRYRSRFGLEDDHRATTVWAGLELSP